MSRARTSRSWRWRRVAAVLLAVPVVAFLAGLAAFAQALIRVEPRSPAVTDAVVVLTGGAQRIGDGLELLRDGKGRRLLISGVHEKTGHDEILRLNPAARPLIACCVDLGAQARNTIGNAIEARRWLRTHDYRSLTVVTSNYHMPRALLEFRHVLGDAVHPFPVVSDAIDVSRWWRDPAVFRIVAVEYVKYLATAARILVEGDPETSRFAVILGGRKPVSPKPGQSASAGG